MVDEGLIGDILQRVVAKGQGEKDERRKKKWGCERKEVGKGERKSDSERVND